MIRQCLPRLDGQKIQNNIKQRADISEGEELEEDGKDEAFFDEGQDKEIQQDAIDDVTLLTPMASTVACGNNSKQNSASKNVFKAPMLLVASRTQAADPFENVMKICNEERFGNEDSKARGQQQAL